MNAYVVVPQKGIVAPVIIEPKTSQRYKDTLAGKQPDFTKDLNRVFFTTLEHLDHKLWEMEYILLIQASLLMTKASMELSDKHLHDWIHQDHANPEIMSIITKKFNLLNGCCTNTRLYQKRE
jgi:hypothetical protein